MKVEPEIGDPGGSFGHGLEPQKLNSNYYTWTDWDFDYPDETWKRYWQIITIRPGMKLSILNYYIDRDIEIYFELNRVCKVLSMMMAIFQGSLLFDKNRILFARIFDCFRDN
jgi:hypothetical protein